MTDTIHTRIRHLTDLYYAGELAAHAGNGAGLPTNLAHDITRAAGDIYDTITHELMAIDDDDRAAAGANALDRLRRTTKERARYHIGATACMHVPAASGVGEQVREVYIAAFERSGEAMHEQLEAMRELTAAILGD